MSILFLTLVFFAVSFAVVPVGLLFHSVGRYIIWSFDSEGYYLISDDETGHTIFTVLGMAVIVIALLVAHYISL